MGKDQKVMSIKIGTFIFKSLIFNIEKLHQESSAYLQCYKLDYFFLFFYFFGQELFVTNMQQVRP